MTHRYGIRNLQRGHRRAGASSQGSTARILPASSCRTTTRSAPTLTVNPGAALELFRPHVRQAKQSVRFHSRCTVRRCSRGLTIVQGGLSGTGPEGQLRAAGGLRVEPELLSTEDRRSRRRRHQLRREPDRDTRSGDANVPNVLSLRPAPAFSPAILYNTAPNINSPFGYPANTNAITTFNSNNISHRHDVSVYRLRYQSEDDDRLSLLAGHARCSCPPTSSPHWDIRAVPDTICSTSRT